jgi:DNA-binding transcriptional MerR regulator
LFAIVSSKLGEIVLLKVGELAKRIGLTIRALHYYDNIGLLRPSGRSDSGYRLYNQSDIARLHGIQALRHLGLPLADIGHLLDEGTDSLPLIISQQIEALDREMAKAMELRSRLRLIQDRISFGVNPGSEEWLSTLCLMATYHKHFSADELRKVYKNWNLLLVEWQPLIADIRGAMVKKLPATSPELQALAARWIDLAFRWMEGDTELLSRWDAMCKEEPAAHGNNGVDAELFRYINQAIELRLEVLHRYVDSSEIQRMKHVPQREWTSIRHAAERLMRQGEPVHGGRAQRLATRWSKLIDRITDNDPAIRERLLVAVRNEPLLQAGIAMDAKAREYIRSAYLAMTSSPSTPPANLFSATA